MTGRLNFEGEVNISNLPVLGDTPAARHASFTGAQAAGLKLGKRIPKVLTVFAQYRRLTMAKAATLTDISINSMCSVWNRLDTGDKPHQLGWIIGTGEFESYQADGVTVKREIHVLTDAGRQAAFDYLKLTVKRIEAGQ